jgi:hypothetical protein
MTLSRTRHNPTFQLPFVFVKKPDDPAKAEHKILIPRTMQELQLSCKRKLKYTTPPSNLRIIDDDGNAILEIADVKPGSVLTVLPQSRGSFLATRLSLPSSRPRSTFSASAIGRIFDDHDDHSYDEDEPALEDSYRPSETLPEYVKVEEEEEETDTSENPPRVLLSGVIPNALLVRGIGNVLESLSKNAAGLIEKAQDVEHQQREFWRQNAMDLAKNAGLGIDLEAVLYLEPMRVKTREIIEKHLLVGSIGYSFASRLVLGGPGRSGKTTFFAVFLEQLFFVLDQCDMCKSVFLMIVNCDHLAVVAGNRKDLYLKWVTLTLSSVVAQVPKLTAHQTILKKYFEGIADHSYLPLLPKRFLSGSETQAFAKSIVNIATILSAHWHDPNGGNRWASILFLFPVLLAKELGFQNVLFLVDNFDSMNMTLTDGFEFETGDRSLSEHFKNALSSAQFVLSYHDAHEFQSALAPVDGALDDFALSLEYHSILDIESKPYYSD